MTKTRFAARGEWIETEVQNPRPAKLLAKLDTPEACAYGNYLIATGRWRVCDPQPGASCDQTGETEA